MIPLVERDEESQAAPPRREPADQALHGNDNLQQARADEARADDELAQSKRRTWEVFARWLMIGGLLGALLLIAVLGFVYSGYP
ncbi:hypothetical protein [Dongia deserti]|uniref:hypothetical protein n=1 Tax=Dongia deserti TaxID=2268030 RepID=UPI000E64F4E7|nr:hypothetical protein [Dongia deserti]